jgi:hypothetical protein
MKALSTTIVLIALLAGSVVAQDPPPPAPTEDVSTVAGKEFNSADGRFTVWFPREPKLDETTANTAIGPIKMHLFMVETGANVFYVSYTDLPRGPETPEENKAALDSSRDHLLANGHRLMSDSEITIAGNAGREFVVEKDGMILTARAFYLKQRLYQMIFTLPATTAFRNGKTSADVADRTDVYQQTSKRFFDSFKLTK